MEQCPKCAVPTPITPVQIVEATPVGGRYDKIKTPKFQYTCGQIKCAHTWVR
jgi:hypothetical protein